MSTIQFNATTFRALFPAFNSITSYPDSLLQLFWNNATSFLSDQTVCGWYNGINPKQQALALNYMTAHLLALNPILAAGSVTNPTGIITSATIDKISVSIEPPPATNQWQWWLNQTPYGQQLLALLQIAAAGGRFYNGVPIFNSFRR